MIFNYDKLKDRMQQLRYNQVSLAKATNIERVTLNQKINNRIMFKQDEILSIANALDIGLDEIGVYFFTLVVKKSNEKSGDQKKSVMRSRKNRVV